jgi:hypothetical protein
MEISNDLEGKGTGTTPKPSEFMVMMEVMLTIRKLGAELDL